MNDIKRQKEKQQKITKDSYSHVFILPYGICNAYIDDDCHWQQYLPIKSIKWQKWKDNGSNLWNEPYK